MEIVLTILEALASVALIVIVLLQSGKEAGLSGAIAGGSETYLGKGKGKNLDQVLASATKWVALAWVILTLSLSLI
ncbi:MAG: preprotein translocase subunit SecG [Oscillospiraceae bacterium]|nr:preprotein translocase subunit SecG [Oscillospiraceae bacterium]